MRKFAHYNAESIDEAVALLNRYGKKASIIAGGTDLIGKLKDEILPGYPEAIINIKSVDGLDFIQEEDGMIRVGALTRLEDIATHETIIKEYSALARAAKRTASPHIMEMGTIGGNVCQDIRCWYYRNPNNRFPCLRKGGGRCYAIEGDNRYHSIFGGSVQKGCYAVHPSDLSPALVALNATVKTTKRTIGIDDFFKVGVRKTTVLENDEIVLEFQIPKPSNDTKSAFIKFAIRHSIDFPIVNCASMVELKDDKVAAARICLNAVYIVPYRAKKAEAYLIGKKVDVTTANAAAEAVTADAEPMTHNEYMVRIAQALIKRSVLHCVE